MRKPLIGLIANRRNEETGLLGPHPGVKHFVEEMGGEIKLFDYEHYKLHELMDEVEKLDGFIYPGGGDMDPAIYGQEKLPECGAITPERDELELNLLPLIMNRMLPILGICLGCQVINVGFGGTLIQDLPSQRGVFHRQDDSKGKYSHKVNIVPGTKLSACLGTETLTVNSYHHQAILDPAPGFTVNAVAEDGTIEGIEASHTMQFIMGVQWHPEVLWDDPASHKIFTMFMDAARDRMNMGKPKEE